MSDPGAIAGARIVVVKIGSSLLVESAGRLREEWLAGLRQTPRICVRAGRVSCSCLRGPLPWGAESWAIRPVR